MYSTATLSTIGSRTQDGSVRLRLSLSYGFALIVFWYVVPVTVVPLCLLCVHRHPEPVDDCPCFEDAIAFMSVVMGEFLTRWYMSQHGYDHRFFVRTMPGKFNGTLPEMWTWWSIAVAKLVVGAYTIYSFPNALSY